MKNKLNPPFLACFLILGSSGAFTGEINVKNENNKPMKLTIVPEGRTSKGQSNKIRYVKEIPAETSYDFRVESTDLDGKSHYRIEGETTAFLGDTCKNLSVEKDYSITFLNDTIGTTCIAEEKSGKSRR